MTSPMKEMHATIKDMTVPIVVAVVVGMGSSFFTAKTTIAVMETRLNSMEEDLTGVEVALDEIVRQQAKLVSNELVMRQITDRLSKIENEMVTKSASDRDYQTLLREIQIRHGFTDTPMKNLNSKGTRNE